MPNIPARLVLATALLALTACSGDAPETEPAEAVTIDSATLRQRQEAVGESRLPGAQGVRGALDASDAAAARAAARDSIARDLR
jgi:outer membrane biogenesis lipoprotein LolB